MAQNPKQRFNLGRITDGHPCPDMRYITAGQHGKIIGQKRVVRSQDGHRVDDNHNSRKWDFLNVAFHASFPQILAEDITISCHISGDANRTQPLLGITNGTQVDLIECDNYLSMCHVNNSNLEKSRSQIECITNVGITVSMVQKNLPKLLRYLQYFF